MPLSGKYDFTGIKKAGAVAIEAALATTSWGVWLLKSPFRAVEDPALELISNWMANKGLVVLNLGANFVNGEVDQATFDKAMDDGLKRVQLGRDKISAAQGKAMDDAVIKAARKYIPFNR